MALCISANSISVSLVASPRTRNVILHSSSLFSMSSWSSDLSALPQKHPLAKVILVATGLDPYHFVWGINTASHLISQASVFSLSNKHSSQRHQCDHPENNSHQVTSSFQELSRSQWFTGHAVNSVGPTRPLLWGNNSLCWLQWFWLFSVWTLCWLHF